MRGKRTAARGAKRPLTACPIAQKLPANWQENVQKTIRRTSQTMVGVVGAGRIGSAALLKFRALGFATQFFDPYVPSGTEKVLGSKRAETLEDLLQGSDVVSLHTPLSAETAGLVDRKFVETMKPGAILVNTSRGGVVLDLDAIADVLQSGQLSAIGFDVMPQEPPQPNRLIKAWQSRLPWIAGRCIINPHTAYYSMESQAEMHRLAAETAKTILLGKWPPNVLNPEIHARWLRD
ncbi:NAD(P)-dependent oxidoreductase [Bradyrhizobium sp. OAE829]|uniref:NAD(P)-dependent oxidoreductase n=1 Tax=Bradyrhizobium sp. OAE829 TaxID=2663807 RepID=UPI00178A6A6D